MFLRRSAPGEWVKETFVRCEPRGSLGREREGETAALVGGGHTGASKTIRKPVPASASSAPRPGKQSREGAAARGGACTCRAPGRRLCCVATAGCRCDRSDLCPTCGAEGSGEVLSRQFGLIVWGRELGHVQGRGGDAARA